MDFKEFEKKLNNIPEEEQDELDKIMIAESEKVNDDELTALEDVKSAFDYSGKLNVRIPKELHYSLAQLAKQNGVSLNQYILYKLSR